MSNATKKHSLDSKSLAAQFRKAGFSATKKSWATESTVRVVLNRKWTTDAVKVFALDLCKQLADKGMTAVCIELHQPQHVGHPTASATHKGLGRGTVAN